MNKNSFKIPNDKFLFFRFHGDQNFNNDQYYDISILNFSTKVVIGATNVKKHWIYCMLIIIMSLVNIQFRVLVVEQPSKMIAKMFAFPMMLDLAQEMMTTANAS